jgi:putative transposase
MHPLEYRPFYRRNLPHFQPLGATVFVTFRLIDSIPHVLLMQWKEETKRTQRRLALISDPAERARQTDLELRRWFGKWDKALDTATSGPFWLNDARIAALVADSLHYLAQKKYNLDTFCILHNHVHAIFTPLPSGGNQYYALQGIMHSLKRYTALEANRILGRTGGFWQEETFDHVIHDADEWERIRRYVLNNPIKAGLVNQWDEWPWTYIEHL